MMINKTIRYISNHLLPYGGSLYVVGGAVRDHFMDQEPIDIDLVVEGLSQDDFLRLFPTAEKVIGNAPVFLVHGYEVALCRREVSRGKGKHNFEFMADETIAIIDDLARRDFTINAMAYNVETGVFIDPFGGQNDIRDGILRPVGEAFIESAERVLRGASFAARFDLDFHNDFWIYGHEMKSGFVFMHVEQVWRHFEKGLKLAVKPSKFLDALQLTGWLKFWPEIYDLVGLPQDPEYHPEGHVYTHTKHVMDASVKGNIVLQLAALCHDMGKASTTKIVDGRWVSPGHTHTDEAGNFLDSIGCPPKIQAKVLALVRCHMDHVGATVSRRFVRRLSKRIEPATINQLFELVRADHWGRPPLPKVTPPNMVRAHTLAAEMNVEFKPVEPLVMGRHLIDKGHEPGPAFGTVLKLLHAAQIEGDFDSVDGGLEWLDGLMVNSDLENAAANIEVNYDHWLEMFPILDNLS